MPSQEYEKVAPVEADTYSDASGSDISGDGDTNQARPIRRRPRTSEDVRRHDRETLTAEDEAEQLLTSRDQDARGLNAIFSRGVTSGRSWKDDDEKDEDDALYEMEQGGQRRLSGESSGESSELDMQKLGEVQSKRKVGHF